MIWYDMVLHMIWYYMLWYMVYGWYDMAWYDMVWYDMICDVWYNVVYGTCEYGKEPSGSIKCGEFLD
jgi:hypothetical protein